jgi:hypothetical protein
MKNYNCFIFRIVVGGVDISKIKISLLIALIVASNMLMAQSWNGVTSGSESYLYTVPPSTKVGIGTTVPTCKLQIWKSATDPNFPNFACLGLFNQNLTNSKAEIVMGNGDPTTTPNPTVQPHWAIGIDPYNNGNKDFHIFCVKNQKFPIFIKDAVNTSDITNKVGINNSDPQTELHVQGIMRVQNPFIPSPGRIDIQYNGVNGNIDAHNGGLLLNWYSDNLVRIGQNNADLFVSNRTYSQQGIGIGAGISTLDAKLHIESNDPSGLGRVISITSPGSLGRTFAVYADGRVYCRRVEVLPGTVPDYVFSPEYKLMPLNELRGYIQQYRHLPNIPSEKEIQQKGSVDLCEMQFKLLEKIEELTLYILEQQKEIEQLKKQIKGGK